MAPLCDSVSSAVVVGSDAESAARVALGLARAVAGERRVAIADLSGASPSLRLQAGVGDGRGITDSFLRGVPLNDVARPAADGTTSLFILPCGGETAAPEAVVRSDRWRRLASGFADANALLLLVASAETPGLDALVPQTDGAISVGGAALPMECRVLAQVVDRRPVARATPPGLARGPARGQARGQAQHGWSPLPRLALGVLGVIVLGALIVLWPRAVTPPGRNAASPQRVTPTVSMATAGTTDVPADTVAVSGVVNPSDSSVAAEFAVEVVATNTVAGANSWRREHGAQLPGVTVSPVLLGTGRVRWHKVLVGAWHDRRDADAMLTALRGEGELRAAAGLVVRVPIALLLEEGVPRGAASARVASFAGRGVAAYALLQDDGSVRLLAGAFETAAATVLLSADLRAAGLTPQVVYRTGRTF